MQLGWIVEVEHEDGPLLYAARVHDPIEAENVVRNSFNIKEDIDVIAVRPLNADVIERLYIGEGEILGPM